MMHNLSRWLHGRTKSNMPAVSQSAPRRRPLVIEELESRTLLSASLATPLIGGGANTSAFMPSAVFTAQGPGWQAELQPNADALISQPGNAAADSTLWLHFVGANRFIMPIGRNLANEASNFTTTDGPARDMSFTRVKFRNVYPGIDVVYTEQQNHLQFHFLVHPGANPRQIKLQYQGADDVQLDGEGNVVVSFAGKKIVQEAPLLFQKTRDGVVHQVGGNYWLDARGRVRLQAGRYNPRRVLVIDPRINNPPIAYDDVYSVLHDHTLTVNAPGVLGNDTDADSDPLSATLISGPSHGDVTLNGNGSFTYVPAAGYVGTDIFSYVAFDGFAYSNTATVTIYVTNQPPVANDDSYSTLHDKPLHVAAPGVLTNDTDGDNDPLTASLVAGPAHAGSFTFNGNGSFSYTPELHWTGTDQFSYQVSDGAATDTAVATINVENHAPTVTLEEPLACCLGDPTILNGFFTDPDDPVYDGPYTLTVTWGDGSSEQQTFAAPGSFQYEHVFQVAGVYTITAQVLDGAGAVANAQVPAAAAEVTQVWWSGGPGPFGLWGNNPGNGTPGTAIGQRVFPDKDSPEDTDHRIVSIKAWIFPAVAGVRVYFGAIDVDDPSANTGPVDNEGAATDNRGQGSFPGNTSALTNANGEATVDFRVSMQPGDNWRAVASCRQTDLNGLKGKQDDAPQIRVVKADGTPPPNSVKVSDPLTVWRRLHLEVDSMGAVAGNRITGQITAVGAGPVEETSTATTNQSLDDSPNRFEDGTLTADDNFRVKGNGTGANFTVDVYNRIDNTGPQTGGFSLVDDDLLQDDADVPMPDTSTLTAAMREAYVEVAFDVGDSNDSVPFVLNVDADEQFGAIVSDNWTSRDSNSAGFWVAYVLGAFQEEKDLDNDPISEGTVSALSDTVNGGCLIYLETSRDRGLEDGEDVALREQDVVVHEVGHLVAKSGVHPVTGRDSTPVGEFSKYTAEYLDLIRRTDVPAGA